MVKIRFMEGLLSSSKSEVATTLLVNGDTEKVINGVTEKACYKTMVK